MCGAGGCPFLGGLPYKGILVAAVFLEWQAKRLLQSNLATKTERLSPDPSRNRAPMNPPYSA